MKKIMFLIGLILISSTAYGMMWGYNTNEAKNQTCINTQSNICLASFPWSWNIVNGSLTPSDPEIKKQFDLCVQEASKKCSCQYIPNRMPKGYCS